MTGPTKKVYRIREARIEDELVLSDISFASKSYWDYPSEYLKVWEPELTITHVYIEKNKVFVLENNKDIIAYYSLVNFESSMYMGGVEIETGIWLEHMFVRPDFIGKGIGRYLFKHMAGYCWENLIREVKILADPNSKGFYEKMGCEYIKEYPSTIEGRTTPMFIYRVVD